MFGPMRASTGSRICGSRIKRSTHVSRRLVFKRWAPCNTCPWRASKVSSRLRRSLASSGENTGTGKQNPSRRYWATCASASLYGIDSLLTYTLKTLPHAQQVHYSLVESAVNQGERQKVGEANVIRDRKIE